MTELRAFHNDRAIKAKTPDELIASALGQGIWIANVAAGTVTSVRLPRPRLLGTRNTKGYLVATLHHCGQRAQVKLHRVIWIAAHGPIPSGLVPDHINRDKADNRLVNLRLVTPAENTHNRRRYLGSANPAAKITADIAARIRSAAGSYDCKAAEFGVSKSLVAAIMRGELWA